MIQHHEKAKGNAQNAMHKHSDLRLQVYEIRLAMYGTTIG